MTPLPQRCIRWAWALGAAASPQRLPPTTKAAAQMALIGIALVGLLLVVIVLLGGHWVRRQGKSRRGQAVPADRAPLPRHRPAGHPGADGTAPRDAAGNAEGPTDA
ncbi:MAG TPA: hypothetical protein VEQ85_15880 [Lacipirellulaceae bacterium]|nr:hypothetical protein [Lacipirellulaceae bacterium]